MSDEVQAPVLNVLDNPFAPEVYADDFSGVFLLDGNLRITFHSNRVSYASTPGPVNQVVIGRLVIPAPRAEAMARQIIEFMDLQRSNPAPSPQGSAKAH